MAGHENSRGDQRSLVFQDGAHLIDRPFLPHRQYSDSTVVITTDQSMGTHGIVNADELEFRIRLPAQRHVQGRRERFAISNRRRVRQGGFRNEIGSSYLATARGSARFLLMRSKEQISRARELWERQAPIGPNLGLLFASQRCVERVRKRASFVEGVVLCWRTGGRDVKKSETTKAR